MAKAEYKRMAAEIRMLNRLLKFAEGCMRDAVKLNIRSADATNVYWMEARRVRALWKARK